MSANTESDGGAADVQGADAEPSKIIQLEEDVINRIAAGEVVVRPANALKELLENSIDAGSKRIMVALKAGGLKLLRIEDDGCGIRSEDLPLLCERFATSKLKKYEDLSSIGTFGFRGEALASISHVSHVTVTTMTASDTSARLAQYTAGKLRAPPRPCASTRGTTVLAEDLFYNNPTRRQALGKESIEHSKVLEVLQKYAVHYPQVSFNCRKAGSAVAELHSTGGPETDSLQAISTIYGQNIARELFPFKAESAEPKFALHGLGTGPNWTSKALSLTLFINHRLVECGMLRKAVEAAYVSILPRHQHPWAYISLELDPATVDVNVHPTKSEVQFLNEEFIAQRLQEVLVEQLRERGGSRTFDSIQLLGTPADPKPPKKEAAAKVEGGTQAESGALVAAPLKTEPKRVDLNPTRVRTDHLQRSLDSVWRGSQLTQSEPTDVAMDEPPAAAESQLAEEPRLAAFNEAQQLTSIAELRAAAAAAADPALSKRLSQSLYVGAATRELALLQCGGTLCLANLAILARECAYQRLLRKFGGPGRIALKEPLPLDELLRLGISDPGSGYDPEQHAHVDVDALTRSFSVLLTEKAEMLNEYLMFEIAEGKVLSIPNALGLTSDAGLCFDGLPLFFLRLCTDVDWNEEKACFSSLCRVVANFSVDALLPDEVEANVDSIAAINAAVEAGEFEDVAVAAAARKKRLRTAGPNTLDGPQWLHEALRRDGECQCPASFARDGTLLDLVSLDQLYRIFERC